MFIHKDLVHYSFSCIEKYVLVINKPACKYSIVVNGDNGIKLKTIYPIPIKMQNSTPSMEILERGVPSLVTWT